MAGSRGKKRSVPRPGFSLFLVAVGAILGFAAMKGRSVVTDSGARNKAKGVAKEVVGAVRQKVGAAVGDEELEAKGDAQRVEGKVQREMGEAQELLEDLKDKMKN